MHYIEICKKAKEDAEKLIEIMHEHEMNGSEIPMEMKIDYITNCMLCKHALSEDTWVPYNREVYGATYPESYDDVRHPNMSRTGIDSNDNHSFTYEDMKKWVSMMKNQDGTTGAHWTIDQTTAVGKQYGVDFNKISKELYWLCLNRAYSDHYNTAKRFGENDKVEFYVHIVDDAMDDEDGLPIHDKMAMMYHGIMKMK